VPPLASDLVRDAASLRSLIRSIYLQRDDVDRNYRRATVEFLAYITDLGRKTELYLEKFASAPTDPDPALAAMDRENIASLRSFWFDLHDLVQPSRDADTLHSPEILISYLEDRLSAIPGLSDCKLLISHTPELNYVQSPRQHLRERADSYAAIVPGSQKFPAKMALIAIPYSQDENLFSNLIICHEIGHFVFEQLGLEEPLSGRIENALRNSGPTLSSDDRSWCLERVWAWIEEIFCDRFAIGLIGPAFSFSYIEMFDVLGIADKDQVNDFADTHPSDSCRFLEHFRQLQITGWWSLLEQRGNTYTKLIRDLSNIPSSRYKFESKGRSRTLANRALKAFGKVRPFVSSLIAGVFRGRECRFRGGEEMECVRAIEKYLSWGVVPATVIRERVAYQPDPVIIVNAGYLFYLEEISTLIGRIRQSRQEERQPVWQRQRWSQRVEQWTMKAIEDVRLPTNRRPWPT
jgi:hypothetical protein